MHRLRSLRLLVEAYAPLSCALLVAALVDHRRLLGESVWVKPLTFSVSIGLNGAALLWLLARIRTTRLVRLAAALSAVALAVEQGLITLQAARGVRSHFNTATPLDGAIFAVMGGLVALVWVAMLAIAVATTLQPVADPVVRLVSVAGSWLILLGASVGFLMVAAGSHTVGAPDGGAGLPFVGWSTLAGDLRPSHFVGLHGLQTLIVVSWALSRTQAPPAVLRAVRAAAAASAVLTVALTGQALAGQPITSLSTLPVAGITLLVAAAVARPQRRPARSAVAASRS